MSVQVRRRREAAGFLSTYVGAQGELLVDTTNNRVQVHDGAAPGGWPAAAIGDLPGRNALINGTFAINQRSYASGAALAANAYAHDRWKAGAGGGTYTFTQTVPDTVVTITAGTLVQAVDAPNVYATAWWLTWTGTATARVWQGAASGSFSAGIATKVGGVAINALLVTGLTLGTIANIEFTAGTLGLVQFEAALPNAGPTRFERRHNELVLCQRYYQQIGTGGIYEKVAYATAFAATYVELFFPLPITMRASPTITPVGSFIATGAQGNFGFSASNMSVDSAFAAKIAINCNVPSGGGTASGAYIVQTGSSGSFIGISAEL